MIFQSIQFKQFTFSVLAQNKLPDDIGGKILPYAGQLTFGGVAGFIVGYAFKKLTKLAAILLGLLFIMAQLLAHYEIVSINWLKIQNIAQESWNYGRASGIGGFMDIMTANLPFAGGFIAGFLIGLKKG